jgi:hypothetical protein
VEHVENDVAWAYFGTIFHSVERKILVLLCTIPRSKNGAFFETPESFVSVPCEWNHLDLI